MHFILLVYYINVHTVGLAKELAYCVQKVTSLGDSTELLDI